MKLHSGTSSSRTAGGALGKGIENGASAWRQYWSRASNQKNVVCVIDLNPGRRWRAFKSPTPLLTPNLPTTIFFFKFHYFNLRPGSLLLRCIWKLSKSSRRRATFSSSDRTSAKRAAQPCDRDRRAETETSSPFSLTAVSKNLKLFILSYQAFAHKNRQKNPVGLWLSFSQREKKEKGKSRHNT